MSRNKHLPCSYKFLRDEVERFVQFWFQTYGNAPLPVTKQDLGATYADTFRGQLPLWALIRGLRLQKLIDSAAASAGDPNLVRWLIAEPAPQQQQHHHAAASPSHLECVPCRVRCTSAEALHAHLQGRRHAARIALERVRQQQDVLQADKGGVRITCDTDAEALIGAPGKSLQLLFSVRNEGYDTVILRDVGFLHTGTTDAKCVLSDSQGVLPASRLNVVLHPDQMYQVTLRCTPLAVSVIRRLLVFNLDAFRIMRPISITAVRLYFTVISGRNSCWPFSHSL